MPKELTPIEKLALAEAKVEELMGQLSTAKTSVTDLTGQLATANTSATTANTSLAEANRLKAEATAKLAEVQGLYDAEKKAHDALKSDFEKQVLDAASKKAAQVVAGQGLNEPLKTEIAGKQTQTDKKADVSKTAALTLIADGAKDYFASLDGKKKE